MIRTRHKGVAANVDKRFGRCSEEGKHKDSLQNQSERGQRDSYSRGGHKARNAKRLRASLSVIASWGAERKLVKGLGF